MLKSVARDWSAGGREERDAAYDRIVGAILRYAPLPTAGGVGGGGGTRCRDGGGTSSGGATPRKRMDVRVAVPGSGLGRLAWEIRSRGYSVEGSDFSLHMLLASDFVLNGRHSAGDGGGAVGGDPSLSSCPKFAISPWLAETKNAMSLDDRLRAVIVPDVDPAAIVMPRWNGDDMMADGGDDDDDDDDHDDSPEFTMLAGEFLDLYSHFLPSSGQRRFQDEDDDDDQHRRRKFHAVACSYFLDTAPSLPHYILTIYHMLEYGGLLVHFGPLMFHWSGHGCLVPGDVDAANDGGGGNEDINDYENGSSYDKRNERLDPRYLCSIDYTWEEVRGMIVNCGFVILEEEVRVPSRYASDDRSMMKVVYDCVFCVARKERGGEEGRMIDR